MYRETVPQKFKKARKDIGFTLQEVERETKISKPKLSKIENGIYEPNLEEIGILADFYGVSLDWIFGTKGFQKNN